eukprot:scaffold2331_cov252-Pinguiococcus_pyrenoidosus.AAC.9
MPKCTKRSGRAAPTRTDKETITKQAAPMANADTRSPFHIATRRNATPESRRPSEQGSRVEKQVRGTEGNEEQVCPADTAHSTQHTAHSTQHTAHSTPTAE